MLIKNILNDINQITKSLNIKAFLIGGIVRDLSLEILVKKTIERRCNTLNFFDFDLVIDSKLNELVQQIKLSYPEMLIRHNVQFQTVNIKQNKSKTQIDIVQMRKESYLHYGSLPKTEPGTQIEDLKRRDFSINTMALTLEDYLEFLEIADEKKLKFLDSRIVDLLSGLKDLKNKSLRILHPKSFLEDPTRLFRVLRYLHIIEGVFDADTEVCFQQAIELGVIKQISYDRRIQEVAKTLDSCIHENYYKDPFVLKLYSQAFDIEELKVAKIFECLVNLKVSDSENCELNIFDEFKKLLFQESSNIQPKLLSALHFSDKVVKELLKKNSE